MRLSFRHYYFRWIKNLFLLSLIFVVATTLARIAFGLFFGDHQALLANPSAVRAAMFLGFRYDLMPIAYINALPFLLLNIAYLLPGKFTIRATRLAIITILCLGYFTLAWIYVCDYGFYSYFQDHINILFFGLFEDDTVAVLTSIWKNYNVPLWMSLILLAHYAFYRLIKIFFSPYDFDLRVKKFDWRMPVLLMSGLVSIAFFARGNFTRLPLSIEDAHLSSDSFINKLAINGPLALNRTIRIRRTFGRGTYDYLGSYGYQNWQEAFRDATGRDPKSSLKESLYAMTPVNPVLEKNPPHVILVVMESNGSYWDDQNSPNFDILGELKKHYDSGILFKRFLPAENGTIGSIVSIAVQQIVRPGARFLSESEFMNTAVDSSGHLPFKEKGYDTHFVYGGKLGWRDLGKYLTVQGYDKLWGADEMKETMPELANLPSEELGNEWGIFDEYVYAFIEEHLRTSTTPQFFLVLTTTNHPPFEYPSSYRPLPVEINKELLGKMTVDEDLARKRFLGLQYANHKMGQFLTRMRNSELKDKVVVAMTGDHSYWVAKGVGLDQEFKRYAVPFYLSLPEHLTPKQIDLNRFGSHEDIFPTLYHLTLSNQRYVKFGENLLGEEGLALNGSDMAAGPAGAFHHNRYWRWKDLNNLILEESEVTPELERLGRHRRGMIAITDLFLKEEKNRKTAVAGNDRP